METQNPKTPKPQNPMSRHAKNNLFIKIKEMGKGNKSTQIRNVLPRRMYKERGQLADRKHLGILEKRKDYKRRSADFKHKDKIISKYY